MWAKRNKVEETKNYFLILKSQKKKEEKIDSLILSASTNVG